MGGGDVSTNSNGNGLIQLVLIGMIAWMAAINQVGFAIFFAVILVLSIL